MPLQILRVQLKLESSFVTPIKKEKKKDQGIRTSKYSSIRTNAPQNRAMPQRASKITVFMFTPFKVDVLQMSTGIG
jgi:hypothetical protein